MINFSGRADVLPYAFEEIQRISDRILLYDCNDFIFLNQAALSPKLLAILEEDHGWHAANLIF